MKAEVVQVTPEMAKQLLEKNTGNRTVRTSTVMAYMRDMRNGKWQENGEPIQIAKDGRLLNGQHRLFAIIKSGTTQKMLVVRDVENNITIYDQQVKRTDADILKFAGYETWITQTRVASSIRRLIQLKRTDTRTDRISYAEVEEFVVKHEITLKQVNELMGAVKRTSGIKARNAQIFSAIFIALKNDIDKLTLERFIYVLTSGMSDGMEESSAIIVRNMILTNQLITSGATDRKYYVKQVCKAIQDFSEGKTRTRKYNEKEWCFKLNY